MLQQIGMWCIIVSIACEYFFLVVNIFYIIKTLLQNRKNPQSKKNDMEDLMIYKWVRKGRSTESNSRASVYPSITKGKKKKAKRLKIKARNPKGIKIKESLQRDNSNKEGGEFWKKSETSKDGQQFLSGD